MATREVAGPAIGDTDYRPARAADLPECAAIWRTASNVYLGRLRQPQIPDDLAPVMRLYGHLRATDPDGFVVAERRDTRGRRRIVGFVAAVRRDHLWFLSMLFVRPEAQGAGLGRALLARVLPESGPASRATCTDSAQPVSNALYSSLGIVPRLPLLRLVGLPERSAELPELPAGMRVVRFEDALGSTGGGARLAETALDDELARLDVDAAGFEHRQEHRFVRAEGRSGFLFLGPDGAPVGYGYASEAGRVGPVAVRERELLGPVVGHLVRAVPARGAFGLWLPGAADGALTSLLRAGFRLEGFPVLLCWDRPFGDLSRYLPISPGLL